MDEIENMFSYSNKLKNNTLRNKMWTIWNSRTKSAKKIKSLLFTCDYAW